MTSEEKREYQRLYYQRNKDRILARCKKYKESHREELREKARVYNRTHREEIQQWASDNRESRLLTYKSHYQRHKYDRQLNKVRAIQYKGSKCSICGCEYDGTNGAIFDFHHVDPLMKDTEISKLLISPNFSDKLKEELDKCICVCSIVIGFSITTNFDIMIRVKKLRPMFTALLTTMDLYNEDSMTAGGIIDTAKQKGTVKEYQKVIAVGSQVRDIKVGDLVCIDATRFAVRKHKDDSLKVDIEGGNPVLEYRFDIVELDGKPYMLLQDRDIQFIIEEFEEIEDKKPTISNIIQPPAITI